MSFCYTLLEIFRGVLLTSPHFVKNFLATPVITSRSTGNLFSMVLSFSTPSKKLGMLNGKYRKLIIEFVKGRKDLFLCAAVTRMAHSQNHRGVTCAASIGYQ